MSNISKIKISGTSYDIKDENACNVVELTQAEYDALPTSAKTSNSLFVITDATAGDLSNYYTKLETDDLLDTKLDVSAYTPTDLSNYYTKSETSGATQISTALASKADTATTYTKTEVDNAITAATSTKQDQLVSGSNIKTINNESILGSGNITIEGGGGGKAVSGGTNISITTGETADTINCTLPISARADKNNGNLTNVVVGDSNNVSSGAYFTYAEGYETKATGAHGAHAEGYDTTASGNYGAHAEGWQTEARGNRSHAEGESSRAFGNSSHAEGYGTSAITYASHSEGSHTKTSNQSEHASGQYNNSVSASTTFGDSGNTLFSVGNGTSSSARHNAFEIRQNGDIYLTKDGQDVKLQDQLGGGGSSYTAGDGIDITNDVISVSGVVMSSAVTSAVTSGSTDVVTSGGVYDQLGGLKLVKLTQSAYDALSPDYDSNTLYIIKD